MIFSSREDQSYVTPIGSYVVLKIAMKRRPNLWLYQTQKSRVIITKGNIFLLNKRTYFIKSSAKKVKKIKTRKKEKILVIGMINKYLTYKLIYA